MKLIIFDIDGTIVDSVGMDDKCFIQTFRDLYDLNLDNVNWHDFPHVTDSGLSLEIFNRYLNRVPQENEIDSIKRHFRKLIQANSSKVLEIPGACTLIERLHGKPGVQIAFATGGWRSTAIVKAASIGLDLKKYVFKTADDHFDRSKIVTLAWQECQNQVGNINFESVTYVGDGLWDLGTTRKLGIDFIGVDYAKNGKLNLGGTEKVINDFKDLDDFEKLILSVNRH